MRLLDHFDLEDPIDCWYCGLPIDLRHWHILSDKVMQCAECGKLSLTEEAVALTYRKQEEWKQVSERR